MRKTRELPTQKRLKEVMRYDPENGTFERACDRRRWKIGQPMGTLSCDGYLNINVDYMIFRAHRLAWVYMTGEDPKCGIDHINGDPLDNRWVNLRKATQQQNLCNKRVQSNNKSTGIKGVCRPKGYKRYIAQICLNGEVKRLGLFDTMEEAKAAYDTAGKILHGDFFRS